MVAGERQPARLHLTDGAPHDVPCAEILLDGFEPKRLTGDHSYGSDAVPDLTRSAGAEPLMSTRRNRLAGRIDRQQYKLRNLVKRFTGRIKCCRPAAGRCDNPVLPFLGFVRSAASSRRL